MVLEFEGGVQKEAEIAPHLERAKCDCRALDSDGEGGKRARVSCLWKMTEFELVKFQNDANAAENGDYTRV